MEQKILNRKFLNPLWIIVLFCSLTEVTLGYVVFNTTGAIQVGLTCFVIGFPLIIAILFFIVVWYRPTHLYAPKDYKKDESFLNGISSVKEIPVNVYLNTNDDKTIKDFQIKFKEFIKINGLEIMKEFPPKRGSWWGKFVLYNTSSVKTKFVKIVSDYLNEIAEIDLIRENSIERTKLLLEIEKKRIETEKLRMELHQIELETLEKKIKLMESVSKLVQEGLQNVDDLSIQIGSLLLVKTTDINGNAVINNYDLNKDAQTYIEQNPDILGSPQKVHAFLGDEGALKKDD